MATVTLHFDAYDPAAAQAALHLVPSACAYALLLGSLNNASDVPGDPTKWKNWKHFAQMMLAFDSISVSSPSGPCLNPDGGDITLDARDVEDLVERWEKHVATMPLGAARHVSATFAWLEEHVGGARQ